MRWAILGTGFISHTVIDAIDRSESSTVEVVAGRSAERLADFASQYGVASTTTNFDEVLSNPSVDVVYVGLPNHQHHEIAVAAAAAGKAVLSEKSLTTTMATAHQLVDGVAKHGTFFVEGLMYLAHPLLTRFVEVLLDGRLGALRSVRGSYAANIAHLVNPEGKGTIYNLGCYPVSLLHLVIQTMGGHDSFACRTTHGGGNISKVDGNVVDAALTVHFESGVLASLQSSDSYGNGSEFAVGGDNGVLRFDTNPWLPVAGPNVMTWTPFDGDPETIVVDATEDAFGYQISMVERNVREGRTQAERPSPRLADSIEIMEMLTEWESLCREGSTA
ncbi:MAG: Gfo/Idh/MocA family oxidoreductase [Acidimicrobiia bacterium]|nr:Gfo/Idh/MocA family oxidoreductase [Acidimicrobiia bacterium]